VTASRPPSNHLNTFALGIKMGKRKLKNALADYQARQRQHMMVAAMNAGPPLKKMKSEPNPQNSWRDIMKQRRWMCSVDDGNVLIVGDGNFSFALALARLMKEEDESWPCKIYATCFDDESTGRAKYADLATHVESLKKLGVHLAFGVDATKLSATLPKGWKSLLFSKIIFNHPHVGAGIKDQDRNVRTNQQLLVDFFKSAANHVVQPTTDNLTKDAHNDAIPVVQGQIIVTLKQGKPYDLWEIRKLASASSLVCLRSWIFSQEAFPGYEHRRTLGFEPGISKAGNEELIGKSVRSYCFIVDSPESQKCQAALEAWNKARSQRRKSKNFHANANQSDTE